MKIFHSQKVKELTYMHSEGIMAGELKHGPLALVDDSMPVMMICMRDPVYVVSTRFSQKQTKNPIHDYIILTSNEIEIKTVSFHQLSSV